MPRSNFNSPIDLAKHYASGAVILNKDLDSINAHLAEEGKSDFIEATSGPLKYKDRRRMGWPYARNSKGGMRGFKFKTVNDKLKGSVSKSGRLNVMPINKDAGSLQASTPKPQNPE